MNETDESKFDHIPSFAKRLYEIREEALKHCCNEKSDAASVRQAVDNMAMGILAEFKAIPPLARWVLHEYVGEFSAGDIVEHTRPAKFALSEYWAEVNG